MTEDTLTIIEPETSTEPEPIVQVPESSSLETDMHQATDVFTNALVAMLVPKLEEAIGDKVEELICEKFDDLPDIDEQLQEVNLNDLIDADELLSNITIEDYLDQDRIATEVADQLDTACHSLSISYNG